MDDQLNLGHRQNADSLRQRTNAEDGRKMERRQNAHSRRNVGVPRLDDRSRVDHQFRHNDLSVDVQQNDRNPFDRADHPRRHNELSGDEQRNDRNPPDLVVRRLRHNSLRVDVQRNDRNRLDQNPRNAHSALAHRLNVAVRLHGKRDQRRRKLNA